MPMDSGLKQRLLGAAVLVAVAVIFLPMLIKEPAPDSGVSELSFKIPAAHTAESSSIQLPLTPPASNNERLQEEPAADSGAVSSPADAGGDRIANAGTDAANATSAAPGTELPPTQADGKYVVHFAAFATRDGADFVMRDLKARGLPAFTEETRLNGRQAVRVRLGPYATQAEAEIVRVQAAQVRSDIQPRVFMLLDEAAAGRTVAALAQSSPSRGAAPEVGFVVQLGAFSHAARATGLQDRLRQAGIAAFTETIETAQGRLIRVNAGPVSSRRDAEQLKAKVKLAVEIEGVVRSHP